MKRTRGEAEEPAASAAAGAGAAAAVAAAGAAAAAGGAAQDAGMVGGEGRAFYEKKLTALEQERAGIKDGTHQAIIEGKKALAIARDRQLKDAALYRELRLREVEALYAYDCKASQDTFAIGVADLRENLLGELGETIKRLEDLRDGVAEGGEVRSSSRKLRSKRPDGEPESKEPEEPEQPAADKDKAAAEFKPALSGYAAEQLSGINFFVTEEAVGEDLRAIQRDWKARADKFLSQQQVAEESVRIADGVLYYNEHIIEKDQEVACATEVTGEQIIGFVQSLSSSEIIVKLHDGTQTRLLISHLRSGRCTIAPVREED